MGEREWETEASGYEMNKSWGQKTKCWEYDIWYYNNAWYQMGATPVSIV